MTSKNANAMPPKCLISNLISTSAPEFSDHKTPNPNVISRIMNKFWTDDASIQYGVMMKLSAKNENRRVVTKYLESLIVLGR